MHAVIRGLAVIAVVIGRPAIAAPISVAVADFDYTDSSGEVGDQRAAHAERLRALRADIVSRLAANPRFVAAPLACGNAPCSADRLDQSGVLAAAKAQHARYVVFGGVRKMSTLIQWGQVEVMDSATGKAALSRTITFRGDSDESWKHAADFIGQMMAQSVGLPEAGR